MRTENTPTREDMSLLMASMNAAQLALWYDIGRRIQNAPIADVPNAPNADDVPAFLRATPDELAAEDAEWDAALRSDPEALARLADNALKAHHDGKTTGINDDGNELQPAPAHAIAS